jgi:hypothetical protein
MVTIDAEAGAQVLFQETFKGTMPLYPTWEEQPEVFKRDFRERAIKVARAALIENPDDLAH